VTEALPLPITGLLGPALVVVMGVAPAAKAFAPFADPIMFLFIGAFILAKALSEYEIDRRFAYWVLTRRWVGERPSRILFAYGAACCFISMWISNTAACAMMFPIGLAVIQSLRKISPEAITNKYATAMMLICAFSASIGGLATPIGSPTNLVGLSFIEKQLNRHVTFFEWMGFCIPIVVIVYFLLFSYLNYLCPAGVKELKGVRQWLSEQRSAMGRLTTAQRNTLIAFGATVLLWITPGILALTLGDDHPFSRAFALHIPESIAAITGACLLFILPVDFKKFEFTLSIKQALDIDWGVILLYGGGIALGQLVFQTKLAETLATNLSALIPTQGLGLILFGLLMATMTTEFTSNVSAANIVVPIVILLAGAEGFGAAIAATIGASLAFMLPISTPPNAIVYSSGFVPIGKMIKYGALLDVIGIVVVIVAAAFWIQ